jgi:hypothetical protein
VKFEGSNWMGAEGVKVCAIGTMGQTVTIKEGCKLTVEDMTLAQVNSGVTTYESEDDVTTTTVAGKLVNNGNIYTGSTGEAYNSTANAWWSGAAAVSGFFNTTSGVIE